MVVSGRMRQTYAGQGEGVARLIWQWLEQFGKCSSGEFGKPGKTKQ
jgi:hypothetical protein